MNLHVKNPKDFGYELSCWNLASLAKEAVRQGIVESISVASIHRFLKFAGIAPCALTLQKNIKAAAGRFFASQ